MKKLILTFSSSALVLFSSVMMVQSQCDSDAFRDECTKKLQGNIFLKEYKINSRDAQKGGPIEYSCTFNKGNNYFMSVCSGSSTVNMVVNLYDKDRRLLATSFDVRNQKYYPALVYRCTTTGIYYLSFAFNGGEGCGVSVLGFQTVTQ